MEKYVYGVIKDDGIVSFDNFSDEVKVGEQENLYIKGILKVKPKKITIPLGLIDCIESELYKYEFNHLYPWAVLFVIQNESSNNLKRFKLIESNNDITEYPAWNTEKILCSFYFILRNIETESWELDISNFLEYIDYSFGTYTELCDLSFEFYKEKLLQKLQSYSEGYVSVNIKRRIELICIYLSENTESDNIESNLNELISEFKKWVEIFPFDLDCFSHLKEKYLYVALHKSEFGEYNPYLDGVKYISQTKKGLVESLSEITADILNSFDITNIDIKKDEVGLKLKKYKLNQININSILNNCNQNNYLRAIQDWVDSQIYFINEVLPIIPINTSINIPTFTTFLSVNKQEYLLELMEAIGITVNGISQLSGRKKSALRGLIDGLKEYGFLKGLSHEQLYKIIGNKIGLEITSSLDVSSTSEEFKKTTFQYLKKNPIPN